MTLLATVAAIGTDPYMLAALLALVVLLSGVFQGALGFGYAIAALTTLPFVFDPKTAHVVISLSGIPVMAMAAWTTREGADWKTIRGSVIAAAVSMPIGLILFDWMSKDLLIRGTGAAILILMLAELSNRSAPNRTGWANSSWLAGALSGFLAGAVSIGGPPIVAFAFKQHWEPLKTKAFITRCLLLIAGMKGVMLVGTGFVTLKIASHAVWASIFAIAGVYVGARLSRGMKTDVYRKIVAAILIVISVMWLYRGSPAESPADASQFISQPMSQQAP